MDNAQELIHRLNHSGKKLSKSHRRIAECIVSHYDKVVFMTASKLGEYVGVSESTVVRFASALGYSGYPQLQKALQELLRHRLTASQRFEMASDMDHAQVLNKVLKADIQNIRSTLDEIDVTAFEAAIDRMIQARHIYVMGLRASAPVAEFFVHYLKFIFPNVQVVTSGISDVSEQLSRAAFADQRAADRAGPAPPRRGFRLLQDDGSHLVRVRRVSEPHERIAEEWNARKDDTGDRRGRGRDAGRALFRARRRAGDDPRTKRKARQEGVYHRQGALQPDERG